MRIFANDSFMLYGQIAKSALARRRMNEMPYSPMLNPQRRRHSQIALDTAPVVEIILAGMFGARRILEILV